MQRRDFLTHLTSAPLAAAERPEAQPSAAPALERLAGRSLTALRDQYRFDLYQDFLPFMERHVIDHTHGGFLCHTDRDGTNLSGVKRAWYEGRGIWVYSFLYNNLAKEQKYLDVARKSVQFILKNKPAARDGLWPVSFQRDGTPASPPDAAIYGDLFIAGGLAEYAKATGEMSYWNLAKEIVLKCIGIFERPSYEPDIGKTYLGPGAPPLPGARILGVWMVLVNFATQALEWRQDPDVSEIAARCVNAVMNRHHHPEFQLTNELLNHDFSRPANVYEQLVYTGHAIETFWMLLYEAVRLKDRRLFETVAERFRRHVEVAWDDVYGGVFRGLKHVDNNVWHVDKVLWAQEEVLIGSLYIVEHTGAQWAQEIFSRMYNYVQAKYPLKQYGFPLWINSADRKVTFERHADRVENFHHPRHLMLNLLSLERIMQRGGRTSAVFG